MTYNIHPIFVHFPIALLFLYSIIKVLPMQKWVPRVAWRDIERVFLLLGVLGAFAGLATGESAEHIMRANEQLVENHAFFASLATWLYGALLAGEIVAIFNASSYVERVPPVARRVTSFAEKVLCDRSVALVLAVIGFVAIVLTGLLGGVIAYGTSADPLANIVLKLLGITL